MGPTNVQFVTDAKGKSIGVFVPIDLWKKMESEKETAYLLQSATMKRRLLAAKKRKKGISLKAAREKLGI